MATFPLNNRSITDGKLYGWLWKTVAYFKNT